METSLKSLSLFVKDSIVMRFKKKTWKNSNTKNFRANLAKNDIYKILKHFFETIYEYGRYVSLSTCLLSLSTNMVLNVIWTNSSLAMSNNVYFLNNLWYKLSPGAWKVHNQGLNHSIFTTSSRFLTYPASL